MVFFDQEGVRKPQTVISSAAAKYRIFQCRTQAGQGFARIQQLCIGAFQQFDIVADPTGYARKSLYKIKRRAFAS